LVKLKLFNGKKYGCNSNGDSCFKFLPAPTHCAAASPLWTSAFVISRKLQVGFNLSILSYCTRILFDGECCFTGCSLVEALEAATLHPASAMGIQNRKGSLLFGCDADLVFLDKELNVQSTWIASEKVYQNPSAVELIPVRINKVQ
jgi:hypothetical protein